LLSELKQYRVRAASAAELVRDVEGAVASGALAPGQRLPSVRRLAADLQLSPATVASGLAELRRRGVVLSEPRRGTRVAGPLQAPLRQVPLPVPQGARDLSLGSPDPELLPDLAAAVARMRAPRRLYGEPAGLPELLRLAGDQLAADGVPHEALCVVSGAMDGIERVLDAHLRPGDAVAVENPGYAALFDLLRVRGLVLRPVTVDDRGMTPAALERALAGGAVAVVITPRGQNPRGAALDAARAGELRAVLSRFPEALVIEDDHLGAVADAPLHSLLDGRACWAATRSVAKALGPDLRLAVLGGDELTIARVQGRQQRGPGWVSHLLQRLVADLWSDATVQARLAQARTVYAERRERLLGALAQRGIEAYGRSGLNVWLPVADEAGTVGALLHRGWVLAPGAPYRLDGSPAAVRITTATLRGEEARALADELAGVLASARAQRSG
jgi:DNA-binding transcriptional MocR family regulator